jgi:hypothetical protein
MYVEFSYINLKVLKNLPATTNGRNIKNVVPKNVKRVLKKKVLLKFFLK